MGAIEHGKGCKITVTSIAKRPCCTSNLCDDLGCVYLSDHGVATVSNVEVAHTIKGNARGPIQTGDSGKAIIAAKGLYPVSRKGGDNASYLIYLSDPVIRVISNVEVVGAIEGESPGLIQRSCRGGAIITAEARRPGARYGGNDSRDLIHPPNTIVICIGNIKIASTINRDSTRRINLCCGCLDYITIVCPRPVADHGVDRISSADRRTNGLEMSEAGQVGNEQEDDPTAPAAWSSMLIGVHSVVQTLPQRH